jgi:hypothetical protein
MRSSRLRDIGLDNGEIVNLGEIIRVTCVDGSCLDRAVAAIIASYARPGRLLAAAQPTGP